jgi:8-oxo-dGTP diphosphatase
MKPVVQKVIVGGIIIADKKVLIIKRSADDDAFPGLWEIPSGKKEQFEEPVAALIREVKEEVGVEVQVKHPVGVFSFKVEKPNEIRDSTQINFLVETKDENPKIKLSSEHEVYAWVDNSNIDEFNLSDETKKDIKSALANLS